MTKMLAKYAQQVVGIDISESMLERARKNIEGFSNVSLHKGRVTDLQIDPKSFDLAFESIVLLHILAPKELRATIETLKNASSTIFIVEHTFEGHDFPSSKYTILRSPEEYEKLFKPFRLVKSLEHACAGDRFTLQLFKE